MNYLVTGSNRGIGFALVKRILEEKGSTVVATARNPDKATDLQALAASHPGRVHIVKLDQQIQSSIEELGPQLEQVIPDGLDVFFANAAIATTLAPALSQPRKIWEDHWQVNVLGVIEVLKVVKPFLDKRKTRRIVLTSSAAGSCGKFYNLQNSSYGITKAAINYLMVTLAAELKPEGYTTVAVHPGMVLSDMGSEFVNTKKEEGMDVSKVLPLLTPDESAKAFYDVSMKAGNGQFLSYDGSKLEF